MVQPWGVPRGDGDTAAPACSASARPPASKRGGEAAGEEVGAEPGTMAELEQLQQRDIPEGRQLLRDHHHNLLRVADYCESNYLEVSRGQHGTSCWGWASCWGQPGVLGGLGGWLVGDGEGSALGDGAGASLLASHRALPAAVWLFVLCASVSHLAPQQLVCSGWGWGEGRVLRGFA